MELVRCLEQLSQADIATAGGKGARLGELLRAGWPVPPGFVLLSSAYQLFIVANGIQREIERLTNLITLHDPTSIQHASAAIYTLFEHGSIPNEVIQAVLTAHKELGEHTVAVRSSATVEDLPSASFAGQHEISLNMHTSGEVLAAVQRCWSSLWTPRALDYRVRKGMNPGSVSLAVIVQQMVLASVAGILFTVNPVTGATDEVVINAAWGLSEAIVGGRVNPDTIITEKMTGRVRHMEIGNKTVMTVPTDNGTTEQVVDPKMCQEPVLTPDQIAKLTQQGCEFERHFNGPQDIEWAIADGQIFLLQSRPVTTCSPVWSNRC